MNADAKVMEFFPSTLTEEQSNALANRIIEHEKKYGFTLWAVDTNDHSFIGFIGLQHVPFEAFFTPAIEIGWRLDAAFWGKGYATEGAKACLDYGSNQLKLKTIVSFTTEKNIRSRNVMGKIGMTHNNAEVFNHPKLPKDHFLSKHVLCKASI